MTAKKGLKSLAESNPEFSNQQIENAVNELKIGWVAKTFTLDTAIKNNNVLTNTQKNNARLTINNQPHLNIGRYLNDMLAHTDTILDGTIIPLDDATNPTASTFLDILQSVLSLQSTIPELLGVSASEKSRDVNDHLGTLNNKFLETEDSSLPVFTSLKESISFINANTVGTDTLYQTALTNMTTFVDSVVGDSTDFQQTLDGHATAVATAATNFNTALGSEPYLTHRTRLIADNERVDVQVALEKSNLTGINTFLDNLNDYNSYTALAEDSQLRKLMTKVAQNTNWITYFNDYEANQANINPVYTTDTDSDKSSVIDQILADSGLPDVTDSSDFEAVAEKARRDSRIDTRNYDRLRAEQQISDACKQLDITTANRTLSDQSQSLLRNLNKRDRDIIADELDSNEDANTLS